MDAEENVPERELLENLEMLMDMDLFEQEGVLPVLEEVKPEDLKS